MLCLNLKLHSINLPPSIISPNDTLRVSITTIPDKQKEAKTIQVKNLNIETVSFKIKFNDIIENIIVVFRKKSFFSDGPIIASTCIKTKDIKENCNEFNKKINLYEPYQKVSEKENVKKTRKIIGSMETNFSVKEEFAIKSYGINLDNIEQRTLRTKLNNFNSLNQKKNQYIFN